MSTLAYVLRMISLAFLSGGCSSIIFAAITLVNAAKSAGVPVAEAAATNAPMFYMYSTVVIVCSLALLAAEALDFIKERKVSEFKLSNLTRARYASSALCVIAGLVFSTVIVPQMKSLAPVVKSDKTAHAEFQKLHSMSRIDFSVIIVCSMISLLLPGFGPKKLQNVAARETPVASI